MLDRSEDSKKYMNLSKFDPRQGNSLRSYMMNSKEYDIDNMPLLDKFIDLLCKCLIYEPHARITANEALNHPFFTVHKPTDKAADVPWPSLPYTKGFLYKVNAKPKIYTKFPRFDSISQDTSPNSKHSTTVSRSSPRVSSSDEDITQSERPASYVHSVPSVPCAKSNVTPKY